MSRLSTDLDDVFSLSTTQISVSRALTASEIIHAENCGHRELFTLEATEQCSTEQYFGVMVCPPRPPVDDTAGAAQSPRR